nr:reverse transcriptase domain-containing protein [Tanacetum cinerariifolium]
MKMNTASSSGSGTLPCNTITNSKEELNGVTTRSGNAYQGPTIPNTSSSLTPVVEREIEATKDNMSIKSLLTNKDKIFELARTPLNEHCSGVLLKKLPEKLWDPVKFLIPCDFLRMAECLAVADLSASINLMPLYVWNKLSLLELTLALMTLELTDRSISRPIGVAEDVYVKVGKFHFLADFVVVDFYADPRYNLFVYFWCMSTRSSARNIFPPLDNPELTIRIRSHADPALLNDFEMATERNGDLPVPDLRTKEGLCQPSLNGRGGPISPIAIQAMNFGLKNDMIQQVKNSYKFHGLSGDDANKHLEKFLHVTQSIKVNGVTNDTLPQRSESSSSITSSFDMEIKALKAEMAKINKNLMRVLQPPLATPRTYMLREPIKIPQPQIVTTNEFTNFMKVNDSILKNMQTNMNSMTKSNLELKSMFGQFIKMNTASSLGSGTLPCNTITNSKEELNGVTTRSGNAYQGPTIPNTSSSFTPVVEREIEATKDKFHPTNNGSTKDV